VPQVHGRGEGRRGKEGLGSVPQIYSSRTAPHPLMMDEKAVTRLTDE